MGEIYYWEKFAFNPKKEKRDKKDTFEFYEITEDPNIRELIRNLESKFIGKRYNFLELEPKNESIKEWVLDLFRTYPQVDNKIVEYILNTFRADFPPRSKEKYKFVVGILLLEDYFILLHCKKDPSLAQLEDKVYLVKLILHQNNVIRADIIRKDNGNFIFSAFERSRKFSKAHADFWQIEPEGIGWESLGDITLIISLDSFHYPISLPLNTNEIDEMFKNGDISPSGKINIGREKGKINKVELFGKSFEFSEFYTFYFMEKEKLSQHKKQFVDLLKLPHSSNFRPLYDFETDKFKYEEDRNHIYEITVNGRKPIYDKTHPRFIVIFSTRKYPRIKPRKELLFDMYKSIFENLPLEILHIGDEPSNEPVRIGNLKIYNKLNEDILEFIESFINKIQDCSGRKEQLLMQSYLLKLLAEMYNKTYIKDLFNFVDKEIIQEELNFEFKNPGILSKESFLEFKSAADYQKCKKPTKFVEDELIPTIEGYLSSSEYLERFIILYGVEDSTNVNPIINLKNDQITKIENLTNEKMKSNNQKITIKAEPIPSKGGIVLAIFLIKPFGDKT